LFRFFLTELLKTGESPSYGVEGTYARDNEDGADEAVVYAADVAGNLVGDWLIHHQGNDVR